MLFRTSWNMSKEPCLCFLLEGGKSQLAAAKA
jgi:hypothetical protein